ncbi:MAG TPA: hypothetical protein PKN27_01710 [Propionibacteriaceae bacterium]|nr:hypothetical protein [Propionibacteriaceae bacterium]
MPRRLAHAALALAGIGLLVWGLVFNPRIACRGVQMYPGDVCTKNTFSQLNSDQVQTYEQRLHAAQQSQPVLIGLGLVVAAFGIVLLVLDVRRTQASSSAIGP